MRHELFNARLHELLDLRERPEEDEELRALAALSPADRDTLAAQQQLFEGLEADELPELTADFAQRVVAQALIDEPPLPVAPRGTWSRSWIFELAAVAALALVAIAGWSSLDAPGGTNVSTVVQPQKSPPTPDLDVAKNSPDNEDGGAAADGAPDLGAQENGDAAAPQIAVKQAPNSARYDELYRAILERLPNSAAQDELLARRPEWVDEVASGLRPVATSLGGAINTLRSTLPPSSKSDRGDKPQAGMFEASPASDLV